MQLPFGEWLPDLPDHMNPGSTQAKNVFPAVNSYRPFKNIICLTLFLFKIDTNTIYKFYYRSKN